MESKYKTIQQLDTEMKVYNGRTLTQFLLKEREISAKRIKNSCLLKIKVVYLHR